MSTLRLAGEAAPHGPASLRDYLSGGTERRAHRQKVAWLAAHEGSEITRRRGNWAALIGGEPFPGDGYGASSCDGLPSWSLAILMERLLAIEARGGCPLHPGRAMHQ